MTELWTLLPWWTTESKGQEPDHETQDQFDSATAQVTMIHLKAIELLVRGSLIGGLYYTYGTTPLCAVGVILGTGIGAMNGIVNLIAEDKSESTQNPDLASMAIEDRRSFVLREVVQQLSPDLMAAALGLTHELAGFIALGYESERLTRDLTCLIGRLTCLPCVKKERYPV